MTETTTTTETTETLSAVFFGLNGWAVTNGTRVLSPQFRTQAAAEARLGEMLAERGQQ